MHYRPQILGEQEARRGAEPGLYAAPVDSFFRSLSAPWTFLVDIFDIKKLTEVIPFIYPCIMIYGQV